MVGNVLLRTSRNFVSESHKHLASWVSKEFTVYVSLNLRLIPNLEFLSCSVDFTNETVHIWVSIQVSPKNFSVSRIISSSKILFGSIINDRNTNWGHSHSMASSMVFLLVFPVSCPTQSSSIIVVITEIGQVVKFVEINVLTPLGIVISKVVHVLLVEESISYPKEERIVENTIHTSHITTCIAHRSIENFTDWVDSWGLRELTPKPFGHFWNSINSNTINFVFIYQVSNPVEKCGSNIVIFLFEIS